MNEKDIMQIPTFFRPENNCLGVHRISVDDFVQTTCSHATIFQWYVHAFSPFPTVSNHRGCQLLGLLVLYCLKNESVQNKKIHSLYNYILFFRIFESGWDLKPSARPSQEDTCEVWYEFRMFNPM